MRAEPVARAAWHVVCGASASAGSIRPEGEDVMFKTIIRTTACLAVSAAAFIVITKMDATAAKPRSPSVPEASEPKPAPGKSTSTAPVLVAPKLTVASLKMPPPAAAATSEPSSQKGDAAPLPPLPNWKGKRLSLARREARSLGFKVTAVDESGETVPAAMAGIYRVRRQLTQAGTAVQFVAREIVETTSGY
jgi:hypothetical protein